MKWWWRLGFGVVGAFCLGAILDNYGFAKLISDLRHVSWQLLPLSLTFVPTLLCYSMVWFLVTEAPQNSSKVIFFCRLFKITVIAIAFNNISPFVKVFGEPIRLVMLREYLSDSRLSLRSVLIYNLTHVMGTVLSFIIAAATIPLFFAVPEEIAWALTLPLWASFFLFALMWFAPAALSHLLRDSQAIWLRRIALWIRWSSHKIVFFSRHRRGLMVAAVFFSVSARFIEGLTFYYAFKILGEALPLLTSAYLDVGRALADNIFFFVPYQLGTREYAISFLLEKVLLVSSSVFVGATILYRLVEILWMIVGFAWWLVSKSAREKMR